MSDPYITVGGAPPPDPTDPDTLRQAEAEATEAPTGPPPIVVAGVELPLPANPEDIPWNVIVAFEEGKVAGAIQAMFGDRLDTALAALAEAQGRPVTLGDMNPIAEAVANALGLEPGKSPASAVGSPSTATPSRPT